MTQQVLTLDDFRTYLSLSGEIDEARAQQILSLAQSLCESVVSPLPAGAAAVVLDVAACAWTNPTNAQSMATGPYSASYGAVGGGLWLTRQNKSTLRRLAGGGGAFSIETLPASAGQSLPWWDTNAFYTADDEPSF